MRVIVLGDGSVEIRDENGESTAEYVSLTICFTLRPDYKTLPMTIFDEHGSILREDP